MNSLKQSENLIFDIIIIVCASISFIASISTLILIIFTRKTRKKDRINNLLGANPFLSLVIFSSFILDMYAHTIYGHLYNPNKNSFNGLWCKIKSMFLYWSESLFMYSLFLQAMYRFFRIVYPMHIQFRSFRIYQFSMIIQWIFCFISILILFILGDIRYVEDDFNCQIEISNTQGMFIFIPIVYCIPSCLTTICYNYTLYYYRKHNRIIQIDIHQQTKTRRDMLVLKRIFMILTFMIIVGLPTGILCIIDYIVGQLPWWSRQFGWLSVTLSYACAPFVLIITSPQLRKLWIQPWHRIHPS